MGVVETRVGWNDMGYMDGSYDETVREFEEECGLLGSRVRFRQEKRWRTKESPGATRARNYEKGPQGTKQPYNNEGNDQAMPKSMEVPTQSNNVPTHPYTMPNSAGRNTSSS